MKDKVYVIEGGQCKQLESIIPVDENHPLWISRYLVEEPKALKQMHKDYLYAGSDILSTVTHQTSIDQIMKSFDYSLERAKELMHVSVEIARDAWSEFVAETGSKKKQVIAGCIGPYGAILRDGSDYTGAYIDRMSEEELIQWHRPRIEALIEAGVDIFAFQTLPAMKEALAIIKLMREHPNYKGWMSFNCQEPKSTAKGEDFGLVAKTVWEQGKDQLLGVGVNCTEPDYITDLLTSAGQAIKEPAPLVAYSNSGEVFDREHGCWVGEKKAWHDQVHHWLTLGVRYVGGCCRTTAADICLVRDSVDTWNISHRIMAD